MENELAKIKELIEERYAYIIQEAKHGRTLLKDAQLKSYWKGKGFAVDPRVFEGFCDELDGYTGEAVFLEKCLEVLR